MGGVTLVEQRTIHANEGKSKIQNVTTEAKKKVEKAKILRPRK